MIAIRVPRPIKIAVIVFLAYLALIVLVAMPALNLLAPRIYQQQTGRELQLGKMIVLNPFTLALSVREAASNNADGSHFWSFDLLRADISLASLWRRQLVLDELQLSGVDLQIEQKSAERYNFSEILDYRLQHYPAPVQAAQTQTQSPHDTAAAIGIDKLTVTAKHLGINAPYLKEPLALDINDVSIALNTLSTAAEKNAAPGQLPLRTGKLDIALKSIGIKFLREHEPFATQLHNLQINAAEFSGSAAQEQSLSLSLNDASGGQIALKMGAALGAKRGSGSVTLHNLDLLPAWHYLSPKLAFNTQRAALDAELQFALNWAEPLRYSLKNSRINLHDVQLQSKTDERSSVALASLRAEGIAVDSALPRAQIAKVALRDANLSGWNQDTKISLLDMFHVISDEEQPPSPAWQIQIDDIVSEGGAVNWLASQVPATPLHIAPLTAHVSNVHWPDAAPLQLQFNTAINNDTKLALQGDVIPSGISGKLNVDVSALPLIWANSLLSQHMRTQLQSGLLSAQAQITLENSAPVSVHSEGAIDQFEMQRASDQRKLLAWKQLQWKQLALDLPKQKLQVQGVRIEQPWAQFLINRDGTNNFQQLMIEQKPVAQIPAGKAATAPAPATKTPPGKPWQFAIDKVHIEKAILDFRDNTLARSFHATIADFSGDVTALSSNAKQAAKVALKGNVDGYAPVALSGTVSPFSTPAAMNLALDITNLDLSTLTPYSGTYAGYMIDSGRLSVQLLYTLENNRIKGSNHIVVSQLQLGKQVSGPKVMDLPLRFAIYLLTDSDGVMDLGVDVSGSVDDPNFDVRDIIWKAFRNLIVKTVTAPFRALANLVGGSHQDDMDRVAFAAGSDQVSSEHGDKLKTLASALEKKPDLKLNVIGHVSPGQDMEALADVELSRQLMKQGDITAQDIAQQSKSWQREVAKLFSKRFPERKSEKLATMSMNDVMRDNIDLPPGALLELANRRALAVKQFLITTIGVPADRVFTKPVDLGADKAPGLQATMEVTSN